MDYIEEQMQGREASEKFQTRLAAALAKLPEDTDRQAVPVAA